MSVEATGLDKRGSAIREMFGAVAPRYDLLNHVLSASLDVVWRRRAAAVLLQAIEASRAVRDTGASGATGAIGAAGASGAAAAAAPTAPVLDLCCGTGDQALALRRRGARVVAADFCLPMLSLAAGKYARLDGNRPRGLAGDALELPFPAGRFAGVTVAFGLRNVADLDRALAEILRVLVPGGAVALLEFTLPRNRVLKALYLFYFRRLLPAVGRLLSPRGSAYSYLPASVLDFPQRRGFVERMDRVGYSETAWEDLSAGTVALYTGRRPA